MFEAVIDKRFDWIVRGERREEPWNHDSTPNAMFATIPTLGAIVPTWALIVPRTRVGCIAELKCEDRAELLDHASRTIQQLKRHQMLYSFVFEHGARDRNSTTGCGVDHAHLHAVALNADLYDHIEEDFVWEDCDPSDPWVNLDGEYLIVSNLTTAKRTILEEPISQYFRRKIADIAGLSSRWNYNDYPFHSNVLKTSEILRSKIE